MLIARTYVISVVAAIVLVQTRAHADYLSESVPLSSPFAGPNVGMVTVEENTGSATVNGLLTGQVRLTFTVNPVPFYVQTGPGVGFTNVGFATDLSITPSQITVPNGWSASSYGAPIDPMNLQLWQVLPPNVGARSASVVLLFSGLGNAATVDHFLTPYRILIPNPEFGPPQIPAIFSGVVAYPGQGIAPIWTDSVIGRSIETTPEPSTLVLSAVGLAGVALARRRRTRSRR